MKLISLHIDNFGQFNNFDYVFEDGINQIIEENGWGKSTLAAFIKVMFFGFDNTSKRDDYVNEKLFKIFLSSKLPYYMVPEFLKKIDKFPLNDRKKIDRINFLERIKK